MLSFRSILFAAAAFATVVSAVPTPDVDSTTSSLLQGVPAIDGLLDTVPFLGSGSPLGLDGGSQSIGGGSTPAKRDVPSCSELIKKCHDDIALIVIKIG